MSAAPEPSDEREDAILLVEDNDGDAVLVIEHLEQPPEGLPAMTDVRRAESLREALEKVTADPPTCVLLDLGLPDADGLEGVRAMLATRPDLPVVVLTGRDDMELATQALTHGAQDYLVKGDRLTSDSLYRAIRHATDRAAQTARLRESHRELSAFAHTVAHDIKTPLTSILGMLQLLRDRRDDLDDAGVAKLVSGAREAAVRLHETVEGLLAYAEATAFVHSTEAIDLDDVVAWGSSVLTDQIAATGTSLVADELPLVTGNLAALRHVFQNLLSNAIKYRDPDRDPQIKITARPLPGDFHEIVVADNGLGIPVAKREAVFALGERLDRAGDGQGIGLNAVRRAVEAHGGQIWIEDGPEGVGTAVHLTLPGALRPAG